MNDETMDQMTGFLEKSQLMMLEYAPRVILAVVLFFGGFWVIKRITRLISNALLARNAEPTLYTFLTDLVSVLLKVVLLISVIEILGVETTSFVAILGAGGLAVGFALQGTLGNFAGGVLILFFKPFKVGDLIDIDGKVGHVTAISIFVTTILTPDHRTVLMPNGSLAGGTIVNLSAQGDLRVDLVIGIAYKEDVKQAREALMAVMLAHPKVLAEPAPSVNVLELADSSVNLAVRPFVLVPDYWSVYFEIQELGKEALDAAGIEIPFPQRVIHQG